MDRIPGLVRRRTRNTKPSLLAQIWWVGLIVAPLAAAVLAILFRPHLVAPKARPLEGYISDVETLRTEYLRFHGVALQDQGAEEQFRNAASLMLRKEYVSAASSLEQTVKLAAVPVVFNDLGVLYARLNDNARALTAFREALSRDGSYRPVRDNLKRLGNSIVDSADPVSRELEPNDSVAVSNFIAADKPSEGDIVAAAGDQDTYRIVTPPPPRDVLAVEIENRSKTLIPSLRVYDSNGGITETNRVDTGAGSSLERYFSLPPNSTIYLQVLGAQGSGGAYLLKVHAMKAFDTYEPNDDVFNPQRIAMGVPLDANIMDDSDTDFYSFVAPRTGLVAIEIRNRSATLIPALSTFGSDRRHSGFGPDLRNPGETLRHRMEVQEHQTYFLQVWSQGSSSGSYTLQVN